QRPENTQRLFVIAACGQRARAHEASLRQIAGGIDRPRTGDCGIHAPGLEQTSTLPCRKASERERYGGECEMDVPASHSQLLIETARPSSSTAHASAATHTKRLL